MAYENFENTSFDLNHDGHIDTNEAAYIHDTFYSESDSTEEDMDFSISSGYRSEKKSSSFKEIDHKKLMEDVRRADARRNLIALGILVVVSIIFADSPGITLFVGAMLLSAKISRVF